MKSIPCVCGELILLDDVDYERLSRFSWYCSRQEVVYRRIKGRNVNIARCVIGISRDLVPDHIDGNCHNNQQSNLRAASTTQNAINREIRIDNTIGYKGVYRVRTGKFIAQLGHKGVRIQLGTFRTKYEAAVAYNKKATELYGSYAKLNQIKEN